MKELEKVELKIWLLWSSLWVNMWCFYSMYGCYPDFACRDIRSEVCKGSLSGSVPVEERMQGSAKIL